MRPFLNFFTKDSILYFTGLNHRDLLRASAIAFEAFVCQTSKRILQKLLKILYFGRAAPHRAG